MTKPESFGSTTSEVLPVAIRLTDNKLNGSNYFEWSKTVRLYLRSMGKASHLTSDPPTNNSRDQWLLQTDGRLFLQIINSIKPSVVCLVNHCEYVKQLIDCLDFLISCILGRIIFLGFIVFVNPFIMGNNKNGHLSHMSWNLRKCMKSSILFFH